MSRRDDFLSTGRSSVYRFGECELQVLTRELWRKGQRQALSARAFDLLLLLVDQRPRAVSHAEIAQAVWGQATVRPNLLARTMMQVRQMAGDSGDEPVHFLSVRGVGYRFAGTVTEGAHAQADAVDADAAGLASLHATLAQANAALNRGDVASAQFLADKAVKLADASGINRERSRALSLASQVAMKQGTLGQAAGLANQALRLADAEGHAPAAAQARVRLARVRISVGDLHGALALLETAYGSLDTHELQEEKTLCEGLLAWTHREVGQFDLAVSWCVRSQASARKGHEPLAVRERTFEVDLYLTQAETLLAQDRTEPSRRLYEHGFALNEALREDAHRVIDESYRLYWLCNQIHALGGLNRLDEAWAQADALSDALQGMAQGASPLLHRLQSAHHSRRADLFCRSRRFEEALAAAERAVQVAESADLKSELPRYLSRGAEVLERAGRFQEALQWTRRAQAAATTLQTERAGSLAVVLNAEMQADTLRRDMEAAREQAQQLALENRNLVRRLEQMGRARQLDSAGFSDPSFMQTVLAPRISEARLRDVPFCIAMLSFENHDAFRDLVDADTQRELMRELERLLAHLLPPSTEVVRWRPALFLYHLPDRGPRRSQQDCQRVEARLNGTPWLPGHGMEGPLAPRWRLACVDATEDATLDQSLARLLERVAVKGVS